MNILCEQPTSQVKRTKYIKDSARLYIKKYFFLDILSSLYFLSLFLSNSEYLIESLLEKLNNEMLSEQEMSTFRF
jgi:hypothetical protein